MNKQLLTLTMAIGLAFSQSAWAASSFNESKALKKAAIKATKNARKSALDAANMSESCKGHFKETSLLGLRCRLTVIESSLEKETKNKNKLKKFSKVAADVEKTALSLKKYTPLRPNPNSAKEVFETHAKTCNVLVGLLDKSAGFSEKIKNTKTYNKLTQTFGAEKRGIEYSGCSCLRDSVGLATAAGSSLKVTGAIQGQLTSRGCFLDKDKVREERGGPKGNFTGRAATVAEGTTNEARLLEYAKTRDINLERCRKKYLSATKLKKKEKMQKCVCGEIAKWKFPPDAERGDKRISVPIVKGLAIEVGVKANGKTDRCGPLRGALVK